MIGLDTNIVVRYVTLDDPAQSRAAVKLIDSASADKPGSLSLIVITELVWVLEVLYEFNRAAVIRVLETLLRSRELVIEKPELVSQALHGFAEGKADIADYLIERSGHMAGCAHTLTFDQKAANSAGMRLLK